MTGSKSSWRAGRAPRGGAVGLALALVAAWELAGRLYGAPLLLPWPSYVLMVSFPSLAIFRGATGPDASQALATLGSNLAITLSRIVVGVVTGAACGVLLGIASFLMSRHCSRETLLLVVLRSLPLFALIPLFVLWFAGSEGGVWTYIAFSSMVIIATGVHQAIANVPRAYLLQARLLGARPSQVLRTVVLPATTPELLATVQNVLGLSWAFSLGAEYTASRSGLGHLVYLSYIYADMGKIAALASVYGFCGLIFFYSWRLVAAHLGAWSKSSYLEGQI